MINFRRALGVFFALGLTFGASLESLSAQSLKTIKLNLPYAVTVGSVTVPAGECSIRSLNRDGGGAILLIESASGVDAAVLADQLVEPHSQAAPETKVTLRSTDNGYQLDKIWEAGSAIGFQVISPVAHE